MPRHEKSPEESVRELWAHLEEHLPEGQSLAALIDELGLHADPPGASAFTVPEPPVSGRGSRSSGTQRAAGGMGAPWVRPYPKVTLPAERKGLRQITIRVDVDDVRPATWRRLQVRSDLSVEQFHDVIQVAFEWDDTHLHRFWLGPKRDIWGGPFLASEWDLAEGEDVDNASGVETEIVLDQVLRAAGDRLFYSYDYGDGWTHTIKVENIIEIDAAAADRTAPAVCTGGRNAGPLENSGGPRNYTELVDAWKTRTLDAEMREWIPPGWNPAEFDALAVTQALADLGRDPVELIAELVEEAAVEEGSPLDEVLLLATPELHTVLLSGIRTARRGYEQPTEDEKRAALRPWLVALDMVAANPLPLTEKGYWRPTVVTRLVDVLGVSPYGTSRREMDLPEIAVLRRTLRQSGFARSHRGEFVLTKRGREAHGDVGALWNALAASLVAAPRGSVERSARACFNLLVAGGCTRRDVHDNVGGLLDDLGWRFTGPGARGLWRMYEVIGDAHAVLLHVDRAWGGRDVEFSLTARALAHDALFGMGSG